MTRFRVVFFIFSLNILRRTGSISGSNIFERPTSDGEIRCYATGNFTDRRIRVSFFLFLFYLLTFVAMNTGDEMIGEKAPNPLETIALFSLASTDGKQKL